MRSLTPRRREPPFETEIHATELSDDLAGVVDPHTLSTLERRRGAAQPRRRGWLVRRMLLVADVFGLALAFAIAEFASAVVDGRGRGYVDGVDSPLEYALFLLTLPAWVIVAKLYGLYDRDEERTDHTTTDDIVGVFHLVTVGAWLFFASTWFTGVEEPQLGKLIIFWLTAIALIALGRSLARAFCRRSITYLQNAVVLGTGDLGTTVGRKLRRHPEYGINLVGFVAHDGAATGTAHAAVPVVGSCENMAEIVRTFDVERVVVALEHDPDETILEALRSLRELYVQIDIVPRLFQLVGPSVGIHTVEGLPLLGLPPTRLSRSSRLIKRATDVVGASTMLILAAPLFGYIALRIKLDSPGPVLFRQKRLGLYMKEFTALKFRTMKVGTDHSAHREFVKSSMDVEAVPTQKGLYKLDRDDAVTRVGRRLRRSSLDELPQLINVLKGDMSLVGPRPCIEYEIENFAPHHFDRFLVPPGLTGLWQVTARASSTFGEALDMDVAYARGWSFKLDLWLLCRTPLQLIRQANRTA
jgi:exopolysaccharide biosynthesis polyprenyl glycosylphosphotransferase